MISSLFKGTEVEQFHTAPKFGRQFVPVAAQRTEKSSYSENYVCGGCGEIIQLSTTAVLKQYFDLKRMVRTIVSGSIFLQMSAEYSHA